MIRSKLKTFKGLETPEEKKVRVQQATKSRYDKVIAEKVRSLSSVVEFPLDTGTQYRFITSQSFNAIVVLDALESIYSLAEVVVAVYRMNLQATNKIIELSKSVPVSVLLSSFFRENKKYEKWCANMESAANTSSLKVGFSWSHAKIMLAKTKCGKHIVFEGSGNLSDNARIEQYLLEDSKQIYEFHRQWIMQEVGKNG